MVVEKVGEEELSYWLAFDQLPACGLGARRVMSLYEHFSSAKLAWQASKSDLQSLKFLPADTINQFIEVRAKVEPEALLTKLAKSEAQAIPLCADDYPYKLKNIHDPPLVLYHKGHFPVAEIESAIGLVGTRRPTAYGQRLAKEFSFGLAAAGVCIVSGMALGVDSLAHRAALEADGKTVAVLGCGVNVCYPSSNRPLYQMLLEKPNACVVSEFFPDVTPDSWRFPARNRIISGLSQGVCVIEAGETSGSLITARLAFEQNREVFAIPGRIDSPQSQGTNKIIAQQVAQLVTSYAEILKAMNWVSTAPAREVPTVVELLGKEKDVYELLSNEPIHFDVLIERTGMPVGELSATLTMLELAGVVQRHTGDWYSR